MGDAADHDVRQDFQFISDYISRRVVKDRARPEHNELDAEDAALMQAGLHVVYSVVSSLSRIADALEQIATNTQKNRGMMQ